MSTSSIPYYLVDVFTQKRFGGNPLAVFVDEDDIYDQEQMLLIAKEMNLAEITFIKGQAKQNCYRVRIFTTEYEVPFAGHPCIGTAYVIAKYLHSSQTDTIILEVEAGQVPIDISDVQNLEKGIFTMQMPDPIFFEELHPRGLLQAIGVDRAGLNPKLPIQRVSIGLDYIIIPLNNMDALSNLHLNDNETVQWLIDQHLHHSNSHSGRTTSFFFMTRHKEDSDYDYQVRMFCIESNRLLEDAATGSANGCFLAYLLRHQESPVVAKVAQGVEMNRPSTLFLKGEKKENPTCSTLQVKSYQWQLVNG